MDIYAATADGSFTNVGSAPIPTITSSSVLFVEVSTTVTTGAASATQTVGDTTGMAAGMILNFPAGQREVDSVTNGTTVVLTTTITTATNDFCKGGLSQAARCAELTVRSGTISIRSDGFAATTSRAQDYGVGRHIIAFGSKSNAAKYRAISAAGTGWIEYLR